METRKLYYEDCHLAKFHSRVVSCRQARGGWETELEATAFYPEGGGQACDLGTLNGIRVLAVREEGERVLHLCEGPLEPGEQAEGILDYARRFDLMQQHTGEHIVSGIIFRRYGFHNKGFHMGKDLTTIDFDGVIPVQALAAIEAEANEALWQDLPVLCRIPGPEELETLSYRTKRPLPWPVRIVSIPGCDDCACCGVHTARTGEVGLIKLFSAVGFRGGTRIEMACGKRALEILNQAFEQNKQVSQAFSAKITETGAAARRMNEALESEKFRFTQLQKQQFRSLAEKYRNAGDVLHFEPGLDSVPLRELADAIGEVCGGRAAVFSGSEEEGYAYALAVREGDLRTFGREMNAALQGRGGGKPNFLQGRVQAARAQIQSFFGD